MNPGRRVAEGSTPLADQLPLPVGVGGRPDAVRRLKRRPDRRQLRRLSPAWHHTARRAAAVPSAETISTTSTAAARIGEIVSTVRLSAVDDHLDPVNFWGELTFLDIIRPNLGWPSWEDWFQVVGRPQTSSRYRGFDNYAYLLQAAGAGGGIALGWKYLGLIYESNRPSFTISGAVADEATSAGSASAAPSAKAGASLAAHRPACPGRPLHAA